MIDCVICAWMGKSGTEDKTKSLKSDFYEEVETVYDSLPRNSVQIIIGDFNAHIYQKIMYYWTKMFIWDIQW